MHGPPQFLKSSVGSKVVMAITGLALAGFLVGHLSGNLLIFAGKDAINSYAEFLKTNPQITWVARAGLLVMFVLHVATGIRLQQANRSARPIPYTHEGTVQASFASRTMLLTGLLVLVYLLMHLAHFTFGMLDGASYTQTETLMRDGEQVTRHDVHAMLISSFGSFPFVLIYVVSMVVLAIHLSHGLHSLFQSLGLRHRGLMPWIEKLGRVIAWLLAAGYIAIPMSVLTGALS